MLPVNNLGGSTPLLTRALNNESAVCVCVCVGARTSWPVCSFRRLCLRAERDKIIACQKMMELAGRAQTATSVLPCLACFERTSVRV